MLQPLNDQNKENYNDSKYINKSETYSTKMPIRRNKNRSTMSRDEEPMDIEPIDKVEIRKDNNSLPNDKILWILKIHGD